MPVTKEQADLAAKFIAAHESGSQLLSPDRLAKAESMVREFAAQNPPEAAPPPREPLKFKQIERGGLGPKETADSILSAMTSMPIGGGVKPIVGSVLNALGGPSFGVVPDTIKSIAADTEQMIRDPSALMSIVPPEPTEPSKAAQWIDEARAADPHPILHALLGGLATGNAIGGAAGLLSGTGSAAGPVTLGTVGKALATGGGMGALGTVVGGTSDYLARKEAGQNPDETWEQRANQVVSDLPSGIGVGAGLGFLGQALGLLPSLIRNPRSVTGRAIMRNEELSGGIFPNSPPPGWEQRVLRDPAVVEKGMEPIDVAVGRAKGPVAKTHIDANASSQLAMAERNRAYDTSDEGQAKLPATRSAETLLEVVRQGRFGPDEGHALIPGERERLLENLRQVVTPKYIPESESAAYAKANPGVRVVTEKEAIKLGITPMGPRPEPQPAPAVSLPIPGPPGLPADLLEQIAAGEKSVPPGMVPSSAGGKLVSSAGEPMPMPATVKPPQPPDVHAAVTRPAPLLTKPVTQAPSPPQPVPMAVVLEPKKLSSSELERMIGNVDDLAGYDRVRGGKGGDESMWARAAREDRAQYQGNAATADAPEVTINVGGQKVTLPRGSYQAFKHAHGEETRGLQARGKLLGIQGENPNPEDPLLLQNVASAIRPSWGGTPGRQDVEQAINDLLFEHPELRPLMKDVRATNLQEQLASGTALGKASSQGGLIARGAKKGAMYADPLLRGGSNISMSMALSPADKAPVTPGEDAQSKYDTLDRLVAQLRGWNPLAPSPRTP